MSRFSSLSRDGISRIALRRPCSFMPLFRMECVSSRSEFIAGAWVFWLMPAFIGLVYSSFVEFDLSVFLDFLFYGMGLLGWLYAVVVGARVVCRDWGRVEEHFVRAQPVTARSIIWAKWWAGVLLMVAVFGPILLVVLWADGSDQMAKTPWAMMWGMGVAYSVAFSAAVVMRQTLTSILVAWMFLVVWLMAQYLASHVLHPDILKVGFTVSWWITPLLALGVALLAAPRESGFQPSGKIIACCVAAVLLLIFGVCSGACRV